MLFGWSKHSDQARRHFSASHMEKKVFKNVPSKIFGRQPLQKLKGYGLLKQIPQIFAWSVLEYLVKYVLMCFIFLDHECIIIAKFI